jgi:hypothetical protein
VQGCKLPIPSRVLMVGNAKHKSTYQQNLSLCFLLATVQKQVVLELINFSFPEKGSNMERNTL